MACSLDFSQAYTSWKHACTRMTFGTKDYEQRRKQKKSNGHVTEDYDSQRVMPEEMGQSLRHLKFSDLVIKNNSE